MLSATLLLAASMVVGQADNGLAPATGPELLKEYAEVMVGRWEGDVSIGGDLVEEQKGEHLSGNAAMKWVLNETALEGNSRIGDTEFKWLYVWDPVSKRIRSMGVDSSGTVTEGVLTKDDKKWIWRLTSLLSDGTKRTNTDVMTITDGGMTHVHEGASIGAKLGGYRGVWKRVTRSFDSEGVTIHFSIQGHGQPVVLLHGFGSSGNGWQGTVKHLSDDYRVITIDMRGQGRSDKPHKVTDYGENMVMDIVRLLDHLQIEKAHMVGYSMGGFVLMNLMVSHPDRVSSAVLGGTGGVRRDFPLYKWANAVSTSMENGKPFLEALNDAQHLINDDKEIKGPPRGEDTKALAAVARSWSKLEVQDGALKKVSIPTLVIYGSDEVEANLKYIKGLRAIQPAWQYCEIRGADHGSAFGHREFNDRLKAFLVEMARKN